MSGPACSYALLHTKKGLIMDNVWFLTVVYKGRPSLTTIMAGDDETAAFEASKFIFEQYGISDDQCDVFFRRVACIITYKNILTATILKA